MKLVQKTGAVDKAVADVLLVWQDEKGAFGEALTVLDKVSNGYFSALKESGDLPKANKIAVFFNVPNIGAKRVLVMSVKTTVPAMRKIATDIWQLLADYQWAKCVLACQDLPLVQACRVMMTAIVHAAYRFDDCKTLSAEHKNAIKFQEKCQLLWLSDGKNGTVEKELDWAKAWLAGSYFTRDLGNTPANICTPTWLGKKAEKLEKNYDDIKVNVLKEKEIKDLNMGALLGVAQGSKQSPRFIIVEYKPKKIVNKNPVVLVGKGVTFDAGGISLKPAAGMDLMKYDMGGAAAVLGTMKAIAEAALTVHVVALIPSVENLPSSTAVKPGDVLTSMSGKTIEVLNTDAEGRLILCDALTYAERYKPQAVIDLATLTGACVVALGSPRAGLLGNNQDLQTALFDAGEVAYDRVWQLPIDMEYREMLKSPFADLANISDNREAGTITAAAFLSEFAEKYPWAHLDIAGVAWLSGAKKGGSGRPVGLLLEYFSRLSETHQC